MYYELAFGIGGDVGWDGMDLQRRFLLHMDGLWLVALRSEADNSTCVETLCTMGGMNSDIALLFTPCTSAVVSVASGPE